ncbi:tetratricopeptide repeat protein [Spirosoma sp. BT702]|uniref:Tetratricopeptide repeat protein n=1 Tax=Spirosoma profusum TaxID=2771354 RepID=A0A926Y0I5_9BACT|nr:tetratricopeptide repeat protein [Spirosoma profusum]MBD2704348.1 tetratricopeptide repeat protein [Spirosoma profusum]
MIYLLITAWFLWPELFPANQISQNNQARQEAQKAYQVGNFRRALGLYMRLNQTSAIPDPGVRLNLGHTYFQLKQYQKARSEYESLLRSGSPELRTSAAHQLGVLACLEGDSTTALALFQEALLENPGNEPARYNFELVKKYYSGRKAKSRSPKKNQKQQQQTTTKLVPTGGQQVERSERQDDLLRRFRRLNLNEAQAMQLLDAMRGDDLPYALTQSARRSANKPSTEGNRW